MKRLSLASLIAAGTMLVLSPSSALAEAVTGDSLKALVNGKRIYLKIPLGGEFPLYYQTNGQVTGDGSKVGLGKYFAPKETGRWYVEGANLCQQFPTWYKGRVSCFTIQKTGVDTLRWTRDDGYSGRARVEG